MTLAMHEGDDLIARRSGERLQAARPIRTARLEWWEATDQRRAIACEDILAAWLALDQAALLPMRYDAVATFRSNRPDETSATEISFTDDLVWLANLAAYDARIAALLAQPPTLPPS